MGSFFNKAAFAATVFLATTANCHMIMRTPIPYGKSTLNNSPLDASGSDFPCKQRPGVYDPEGAQNIMAIGESQTLSFTGSAVHGGGSCQVSLTTDLQPTKDSKWMVIKSIEGGCPANVPGNLPADPNGTGASTFQYAIPEGIAPGEYTLAWTWFNKVGNREMYMNCAGVQVVASKKRWAAPKPKRQASASFPEMVVCNLASINDCHTTESEDYIFENPGQYVEKAGSGPFGTIVGGGGGNVVAQATANGAPAATGAQSATGAPAITGNPASTGAPAVTGTAASGNGPSVPSGQSGSFSSGFAYGGGNGGNGVAPTAVPTAALTAAPTATGAAVFASGASSLSVVPVATGSPSTGSGNSSSETSSSGSCTAGDWKCAADGLSFSRCVSGGTWSVEMQMAKGMTCTPGVSANLDMQPTKAKRSHSHGFKHVFAGRVS